MGSDLTLGGKFRTMAGWQRMARKSGVNLELFNILNDLKQDAPA
jgi:hypothetical protein